MLGLWWPWMGCFSVTAPTPLPDVREEQKPDGEGDVERREHMVEATRRAREKVEAARAAQAR